MTQHKMLCDMYQDQLASCALNLLHLVQAIVLGTDSEKKVNDAQKLTITQLHQQIHFTLQHPKTFEAFHERIMMDVHCRALPHIVVEMCKAYIDCLQLTHIAVPPNPLEKLWHFTLRTCFEQPILLNVHDDRQGKNLELFRSCLCRFYAECLLPIPKPVATATTTTAQSSQQQQQQPIQQVKMEKK